jgi:hypothetical protein
MFRNLKNIALSMALVVVLTSFSLAGCSSDISQNQSSSSGQQTSASTEEQSIDQPKQQQPPDSSGQNQFPGASNMAEILNRAAEILGVSSDDFIAAFNNAMPGDGVFDSGQQGQPSSPPFGQQEGQQPPAPPSGQQGQLPIPPSDQQEGQQPPAPPSDQQQGQQPKPPQDQQMSQSQFMTEVYAKMAAELNISADDIAEAIAQAEKELQD